MTDLAYLETYGPLIAGSGGFCDKQNSQEAQLSQRDRAAPCLNFGKNISAKSVHLTLLYVTALTSTNHHFTVLWHHLCI